MNSFEIIKFQCPSCGGSLEIESIEETKCKYCGTISIIIPPVKSNLDNLNIAEDQLGKLKNILFVIEQSITAGNFKEAYDFCNKGLEINASLGSLWENKAICAYWLEQTDNLISTDAREILTFLNAAKKVDPNSKSFQSVAEKIFSNLFNRLSYSVNKLDWRSATSFNEELCCGIFTEEVYKKVLRIMNVMELCYDVYPDLRFLDYVIKEFSGHGKLLWTEQWPDGKITNIHNHKINFNASEKTAQLINKIKKDHPNYNPPKIKLKGKVIKRYNVAIIIIFILISIAILIYVIPLESWWLRFFGLLFIAIMFYYKWPSKFITFIFKQQNNYYTKRGIDYHYYKNK